jgi:hypothetical protein
VAKPCGSTDVPLETARAAVALLKDAASWPNTATERQERRRRRGK